MPAFLTPAILRLIALGAAFLAFGGFCAYRMHAHDQIKYDELKDEYSTFKGGVAALGKAAEIRTKSENEANAKRKADADAASRKTKADLDGVYAAYQRLRDQRGASGSILSNPAPTAGSAAVVTFDRTDFDRAISDFDAGAVGILKQGDEAIGALNTAKAWAKK